MKTPTQGTRTSSKRNSTSFYPIMATSLLTTSSIWQLQVLLIEFTLQMEKIDLILNRLTHQDLTQEQQCILVMGLRKAISGNNDPIVSEILSTNILEIISSILDMPDENSTIRILKVSINSSSGSFLRLLCRQRAFGSFPISPTAARKTFSSFSTTSTESQRAWQK